MLLQNISGIRLYKQGTDHNRHNTHRDVMYLCLRNSMTLVNEKIIYFYLVAMIALKRCDIEMKKTLFFQDILQVQSHSHCVP